MSLEVNFPVFPVRAVFPEGGRGVELAHEVKIASRAITRIHQIANLVPLTPVFQRTEGGHISAVHSRLCGGGVRQACAPQSTGAMNTAILPTTPAVRHRFMFLTSVDRNFQPRSPIFPPIYPEFLGRWSPNFPTRAIRPPRPSTRTVCRIDQAGFVSPSEGARLVVAG